AHWSVGSRAHASLAVLTTAVVAFASVLALLRYYVGRRSVYLWLGAGFGGVALLHAYHALLVIGVGGLSLAADPAAVEPWSWLAAQTALALYLLFGWITEWRTVHRPLSSPRPAWAVYLIVATSVAGSLVALVALPPPGPYYASGFLGRPYELLPVVPLLVVAVGYLVGGRWRRNTTRSSLVLATVLLSGAHLLLLPFSRTLYDPLFYLGQVAVLLACGVVAAGLLASTFKVFALAEHRRAESLRKAFDLRRERARVEHSFQNVAAKDVELRRKVEELEKTRGAVLNVMEDLEQERHRLSEEKAKDEAILAGVGEGLVVTDPQRRITYLNRAAERLTGFTTAQVLGQRWPEVATPHWEDGTPIPPAEFVVVRALQARQPRTTGRPFVFRRADGTGFPAAVTAAPVLLAGQTIGTIIVFRDITRERDIDKAKTEFVSLASHQLRTPLSTIKWYAETLLDGNAGKLKTEQLGYLQEVYNANERMVDLVNALLNVSRIEMGTFSVVPQPTDVAALVRGVLAELKPQATKKRLALHQELDASLPTVSLDPNLLRIVVQNLLSNAVQYTPARGSVTFRLATVRSGQSVAGHRAAADSILLRVEDTGIGIPREAQPKIFTKLFRADNARVHEPNGTGLGLYIVKSIVDHAGGVVWFDSVEGTGSTFYVLLPMQGMRPRAGSRALR
ncbi:MAG: ATP-binding protein, partial [Candidatus Andersenbacteria bacterium]